MNNKDIFTQIYNNKIWGNGIEIPYSGSGSKPANALPYVEIIKTFISDNEISTILDFGHGDFEIWKSWGDEAFLGSDYLGIDVAEGLSDTINLKHGNSNRRFKFLDISQTSLPPAQLLISKDVLQHLPILDVTNFINQFLNYENIIICNDIYIRGSIIFELKEFIQLRKRLLLLLNRKNPFFWRIRINNIEIAAGQFRGIDLEKKPFSKLLENFQIKKLADYDGPFRPGIKKRVYLLTRMSHR
jgi:hypothetical protein